MRYCTREMPFFFSNDSGTRASSKALFTMSGALPQQPEEFLDHVRNVPHDYVPSVDDEVDEFLMLREVSWIFSIVSSLHKERGT